MATPTDPIPPATPAGPPWLRRWVGRIFAAYLTLRMSLVVVTGLFAFIVVTAVAGAWLESTGARLGAGLLATLLVPLLARWRLRQRVARALGARGRPRLSTAWFVLGWNAALVALLCLGFSDAVGRSVRRRGDWFLGEADGWLPRRYRRSISAAGLWMEKFDVPPEAQPLLAEAALPQDEARFVGREPTPPVVEPARPGDPARPPEPMRTPWFYPLAGPTRVVPPNAACRFGAPRPGVRPAECELGHCGIDLVQPEGSPVHAAHDGVVLKVVRDEAVGGIAGRFLMLTHKGGGVQTSYIHLQDVRADLRAGMTITGGELVGTLGRTGARRSGPHLHFALAVRQGGGLRYVDPEPIIRHWRLPNAAAPTAPTAGGEGVAGVSDAERL